jgi:hypothetical protein
MNRGGEGDKGDKGDKRERKYYVSLFCHFPGILNKRRKKENPERQVGQWM